MTPRAMISPWVDVACGGGASIVVLLALLAGGAGRLSSDILWVFSIGVLVNWPHFIASYRLLYVSSESVRAHRLASTVVPAALAAYVLFAVAVSPWSTGWGNGLLVAAGLYLARHYTGQTWGMMAAYAFVEGAPFEERERRLVRAGLNLLMVWHVIWAADQAIGIVLPSLAEPIAALYGRSAAVALAGAVLGFAGLGLHARRLRRLPPLRVLVTWAALLCWYAAMAREPSMLLVVQAAHALQYLVFPLRVELNRAARGWRPGALQLVAWTLVGLAVFEGAEPLFRLGFTLTGGDPARLPRYVAGMIISAIALHHYFIDGALYKLRNPEVRRQLFAHLPRPATR